MGPVQEKKTVARSFRFAVEGVMHALRTQRHMKVHFVLIVLVMVAAIILQVSTDELLVLFLSIALVLITELFNTAIESALDITVRSYHPIAKLVKDVSAGAVLVASINAGLVGTVIFASNARLGRLLQAIPAVDWTAASTRLAAAGAILASIAVMVIKTRTGRGTLMRGGVISGHTALAFFFATMVVLVTRNAPASVLALAIAGMLAHSRVQAGIHSIGQVALGALLGGSLTGLFYGLLYLTGSVWAAGAP